MNLYRIEANNVAPPFHVISGNAVNSILAEHHTHIIELVKQTYLQHHASQTINPDSYFLQFPDQPKDRIIALPAAITGEAPIAGIKWIPRVRTY